MSGASAWRETLDLAWRYRAILWRTAELELRKRYAGTAFGAAWFLIYPVLLLSIYVFVFLGIFRAAGDGEKPIDFVLFVFAGLLPFLGIMEAVTLGCVCVKQNMHLVRNVMLPIALVPLRTVLVAMVPQFVMMCLLLGFTALHQPLTWHVLLLPLVLALTFLFLVGVVYVVSALGVIFSDLQYIVGLGLLLLMFVSPIGYRPQMVPNGFEFLVVWNPVSYLMEMVRHLVLYGFVPPVKIVAVYLAICLVTFVVGCAFFRRFKNVLVDHD